MEQQNNHIRVSKSEFSIIEISEVVDNNSKVKTGPIRKKPLRLIWDLFNNIRSNQSTSILSISNFFYLLKDLLLFIEASITFVDIRYIFGQCFSEVSTLNYGVMQLVQWPIN